MKNDSLKLKAFISYSHKDMGEKRILLEHFTSINKLFNIEVWHDGRIDAGGEIASEVLNELETSNIVLLLISSSFINSDFCYNIELKKSIERSKRKNCIVIPIILKKTSLNEAMPFYSLKSLPTDRKPISSFRPKNDGYVDVIDGITSMLKNKFPNHIVSDNASHVESSVTYGKDKCKPLTINLVQNGQLKPYALTQELVTTISICNTKRNELSEKLTKVLIDNIRIYGNLCQKNTKNGKVSVPIRYKREKLLKLLLDISTEMRAWLFVNGGVRIHFRFLHDNTYNCAIALSDDNSQTPLKTDWNSEIKQMSQSSLISHSAKLKLPLVKSLNTRQNEKGYHADVWTDFISCAMCNIYEFPNPIMSFGISIHKKYKNYYINYLYALAHLRIDMLIEKQIKIYIDMCHQADNTYDIKKIIDSFKWS